MAALVYFNQVITSCNYIILLQLTVMDAVALMHHAIIKPVYNFM